MCKVTVQETSALEACATKKGVVAAPAEGDDGAHVMQLIPVMAAILTHVAERDHSYPLNDRLRPFHSMKVPPISTADYLQRIAKYAYCSPECYIFALVYLDRLVDRVPHCRITPNNVHRLLITSVMVAAKGRDDKYYSNSYYSAIGGVTNAELNKLELSFLSLINYDLYVSPEDCERYTKELLGNAAYLQSK
jgi:hypothetical protein